VVPGAGATGLPIARRIDSDARRAIVPSRCTLARLHGSRRSRERSEGGRTAGRPAIGQSV